MSNRYASHRWTILVALVASCLLLSAIQVYADDDVTSRTGSFIVSASGGFSSPTGRFGETDTEADPPKSGHDHGLIGAVDVSYALTPAVSVGVGVRMTRFNIDFGPDLEAQYPTNTAHTTVMLGELSAHLFLPDGFQHWRPYAVVAFGIGRPKGTIEYKSPFIVPLPDDQGSVSVQHFESTVDLAASVSGGIGVEIPLTPKLGFMIEPRYTVISTKGTSRTDTYKTTEGESIEAKDTAKSNTNWWEVRGGVTLTL